MPNSLVAHWDAAHARALQQHPLSGSERGVFALILALVAVEDGAEVEDISLWSVRYRLADPQQLHQTLAALLPGPLDHVATTVADGQKEFTRIRIDALVDEHGHFTGRADLEDVFTQEIEAVVRDRGAFAAPAPMEGRIWRLWAALQAPHGIPFEDTLTSEELAAHDARGRDGGYKASGKTVFDHSAQRLIQFLDRLLLPASGAPPLYSEVLVTGGTHQGRSGRLHAVTWSVDAEQRACREPPASFTISFDDRLGRADIAPADVMPLPQWHRRFAVVHAGQPMPMEWGACVLLADPEPDASWQHSVITVLKDGWQVVNGRLVVLVPHRPDGQMPSDEQEQWLRDAYAWADQIITTRAPVSGPGPLPPPGPVFDLEGACDRLILQVATPDEATRRWARQRAVPVAPTPADAAAAVLKRLGRGWRRQGGERQVRLPVVRNYGYHQWRDALRQAGRLLDAATIDWTHADLHHPGEASWWAITAQVRHPDDLVTEELVVGRGDVLSLIAFRRHPVWTDSEVVLLRHPLSLGAPPPITAPTRFPLRLPTADFDSPRHLRGDRDQGLSALAGELGLVIDRDRLRSLDNRPESALLAAQRRACYLELTDDECEELKARHAACGDTAAAGAVEVHRVADLLSSRSPGDALVDWATLGVIMRAVVPT